MVLTGPKGSRALQHKSIEWPKMFNKVFCSFKRLLRFLAVSVDPENNMCRQLVPAFSFFGSIDVRYTNANPDCPGKGGFEISVRLSFEVWKLKSTRWLMEFEQNMSKSLVLCCIFVSKASQKVLYSITSSWRVVIASEQNNQIFLYSVKLRHRELKCCYLDTLKIVTISLFCFPAPIKHRVWSLNTVVFPPLYKCSLRAQ